MNLTKQDGWHIPSGGDFFYGIQAGKSIGQTLSISLRLGVTDAQGKDENALIPKYAMIGLNKKF